MSPKQRVKASSLQNLAESPELDRAEWDFGLCPPGREEYCFQYEYAREAAWIVDEYRLAKTYPRPLKADGAPYGFDKFLNWHFSQCGDDERGDDWSLSLQLPIGFPDLPYLQTVHEIFERPIPEWAQRGVIDCSPTFGDKAELKERGASENWLGKGFEITINWYRSDKEIVDAFRCWLKRKRPHRPKERRGQSNAKRRMADLKALGAYRLMKRMTAEDALTYTKKFLPHGLYAKTFDWYEAKARALHLLEHEFRFNRPSVAARILSNNGQSRSAHEG